MRISMFGSSLLSAYWNGAATYYRGMVSALAARGHRITFFEPDAFNRQAHRDICPPDYAQVVVYPAQTPADVLQALERARDADVVIKASGVGVFDELLEREVLSLRRVGNLVVFWDVDAPATLARVASNPLDAFIRVAKEYDLVLTYGGGPAVRRGYRLLGVERCIPIYNALDPMTHFPVPPNPRFTGLMGFLGNRLPDREQRVHEFLFHPARHFPDETFLLGGSGWDAQAAAPSNVKRLGHVFTSEHNAFNSTPHCVINVNRDSMVQTGFSPPTRIFEAAGAAACLIIDSWEGLEQFLSPGTEALVARDGDEVVRHLRCLDTREARRIGEAARRRVLAQHTYAQRALEFEAAIDGLNTLAGVAA